MPDAFGGAFLPIGLERARLIAEPGDHAWCHARLRPQVEPNGDGPRETLVADLTICDADGRPLVELSGLSLKRADQSVAEPLDRLLYEIAWRSAPRPATQPEPESLAARASALLLEEPNRTADLQSYRQINEQLDELSLGYVVHALDRLGWRAQPGEWFAPDHLANRLGVAAHNQRLLRRFLEILAEDGVIRADNGGFVVERTLPDVVLDEVEARRRALLEGSPEFLAELTLLGRCGASLAEVLTGRANPLHLLFPDGDASAAEHLYTASPVARTFNAMVRSAVSEIVNADPERPLRILEVGGGTGGTTAHLLPVLPADRCQYVFTDISPAFTAKAASKFSAYPFVDYRPLDIERDPSDQGFETGRYDIVLAVNVVHAVRDLRESLGVIRDLLAPGGLLLLVEVTAPMRWIDLTFGLTDGWWRFTDHDLRPAYPLLSDDRWLELLAELGFEVAGLGEDLPVDQALLIARAPVEPTRELSGDWLVYADSAGVGDELAASISERGGRPIIVKPGDIFDIDGTNLRVDPLAATDFKRLIQEAVPDVARLNGVVYLWGLDAGPASTLDELGEIESRVVGGALHAVQATVAAGGSPRLWLVTRGAQPGGTTEVVAVEGAPLWGFGRALALEHPELRPTRVDLDPASEQPATDLLHEILTASDEAEIALRADERLVPRLARLALPDADRAGESVVELTIAARGTLDGLELRPAQRRVPGAGEVEIRVGATGLNFKDVMNVLGMYPGDPGPLGGECAGTIVAVGSGVTDLRPGDEMVALAGGSFRSYITVATDFVAPRPARLNLTSAATTAIAYVTASIALEHLGRIRAGERALIHAGSGGVGMAAVHLALAAGAEVFATAGSPEKRAFLRDLGVHHVYSSRTLEFAAEVLADTAGEGVDLVLNSLAGEFVPRSVGLLRRNGRFLELGKRDHMSPEDIAALDRDLQYHIIDWGETAREDPPLIRGILHDVLASVEEGRLPSLPVRAFPIDEAADAFRYMARARHIGKVAVTYPAPAGESPIRSTGFYLITGGLRGLGLEVARRLVERGARRLLLMGRGAPDSETLHVIAELEGQGAEVLVHQGDVARQADIEAALAEIDRADLPLLGVFHCAGVLDDGALTQQTWERFQQVMGPKVDGAWLLHRLTTGRPVEHFVLFSSVAAVLGSPGQANHSAANAYLDALAWQRRAAGLPALSINWGAWSRIGAAADEAIAERTRKQGLDAITPERGLQALEALLRAGPAQAAVASVRWPAFLGR